MEAHLLMVCIVSSRSIRTTMYYHLRHFTQRFFEGYAFISLGNFQSQKLPEGIPCDHLYQEYQARPRVTSLGRRQYFVFSFLAGSKLYRMDWNCLSLRTTEFMSLGPTAVVPQMFIITEV